jgi:hypothetical protein
VGERKRWQGEGACWCGRMGVVESARSGQEWALIGGGGGGRVVEGGGLWVCRGL